MDASAAPAASPSPVPRPRLLGPRVRLVLALGCALALVLAMGAYVVIFSGGPPPAMERHVEFLSQGQQDLNVPIMTLYTAPPIPGATVDSTVSWKYSSARSGPSTTYRFHWNVTSPENEPVRFGLNSSLLDRDTGSFEGIDNGALFHPAGPCPEGCTRTERGVEAGGPAGVRQVVYEMWQLRYAVRRVTEVVGTQATSFLEVDFAFDRIQSNSDSMPAAGIADPAPDQRASLGVWRLPAGNWVKLSAQGQTSVPNLFRNLVTAITFDAGRLGTLSARLDSQYSWSPADDYSLSFSASTDATVEYSIDLRFGSLLIDYVAWPYP